MMTTRFVYLLAVAVTFPSAIHSLTTTNRLITPDTNIMKNSRIYQNSFSSNRLKRNILPPIYSKNNEISVEDIDDGLDFKDISIDDVLQEAENALKAAESSIVEDNEKEQKKRVLLEVDNAPRVAESSIVSSIQGAARRQVEKATNDIKAIPSNIANSAKEKAAQQAKEAKQSVKIAIDAGIENTKKVLFVVAFLSFFVGVEVLIKLATAPVAEISQL